MMDGLGMGLAAASFALFVLGAVVLARFPRARVRLPWLIAGIVLVTGTSVDAGCTARSVAISDVESQLFPSPENVVAVYDVRSRDWLLFGGRPGDSPSAEIRLASGPSRRIDDSRGGVSASPIDTRPYRVQILGSSEDVRMLSEALDLLSRTRYGSGSLDQALQDGAVAIALSDRIGLDLPNGHVITTGGTAVTEGKRVTISRSAYAVKGPEVLAAMIAHELTHVVQNSASGTAWWQWPWTTLDRETTAHMMQAVVWAELRGYKRDGEQDANLRSALDRERLRERIRHNPAYPVWLAPDVAC